MQLTNLIHTFANLYLPKRLVGYVAARGVLQRYRQGVMIEREMAVLPHLLSPGDRTIDIGANIGEYTFRLAKLIGNSGRVFAFEPIPQSFNKLKSLVHLANLANVEIYQVALGEMCGTTTMSVEWGPGVWLVNSAHVLAEAHDADRSRRIQVAMETLDWSFAGCARFHFIKCHAEGTELPILRGSENILRRWHPHLLVEVSDLSSR